MVLQTDVAKQATQNILNFSERIALQDGAVTAVHFVRYNRKHFSPQLVVLKKPEPLVDWCSRNAETEAITGGYFLRQEGKLLGETWVNGTRQSYVPFAGDHPRGTIHIVNDQLKIIPRNELPSRLIGDMLEVEPTLVSKGVSAFMLTDDPDGFSQADHQHDEPLNSKRFPRTAIGYSSDFIWTVTADGRSPQDAGLYLEELADIMVLLGVEEAVNLDGGSSAAHISGGKLLNNPRSYHMKPPFSVYSAIVLRPKITDY